MGEVLPLSRADSTSAQWYGAEVAVLGCLIVDITVMSGVADLQWYHFREIAHQRVFLTIKDQWEKGLSAEPLLLLEHLENDKALGQLGGLTYLQDIAANSPMSILVGGYAASVMNNWVMREVKGATASVEGITDGTQAISAMYECLARIEAHAPSVDSSEDARSLGLRAIERLTRVANNEIVAGLKTGLSSFDRRIGGLVPEDVTVIAGSTSMGKSSLARNVLYGAANLNPDYVFAYYSLEMSKEQLTLRAISADAWLNGEAMPYNTMKSPTLEMVEKISQYQGNLPSNLFIADKKRFTVDDLRRSLVKLKQKHGKEIGGAVVDLLQLVTKPDNRKDNLSSIIDAMTAEIKRIAGDLKIPIIILSHINRQYNGRDSRKPVLTDLRESGGIEQNASNVVFVYREHQVLKDMEPKYEDAKDAWRKKLRDIRNDMTLIWGKVRDGEVGEDKVYCGMAYDLVLESREQAQNIWLGARQ